MGYTILGTGSAAPGKVLTNEDLSSMMDTSDEWIVTRTGIRERRILADGETMTELAVRSARDALADAGRKAEELDLILCATLQSDCLTPSLACALQAELGSSCPAFDINAACSGFLYALDVADMYFRGSSCQTILVVAAEAMSRHVNWKDRSTCVLFGDGCAAVVLERGDGMLANVLRAKGETQSLNIADWGEGFPVVHMAGGEVFKFAVQSACRDIREVLRQAGLEESQVDHVILHQANARILQAVAGKLSIDQDRYANYIAYYGNTSAASVPMTLDQLRKEGKLKDGEIIVMAAFGGGYTSGACVIRWKGKDGQR